MTMAMNKKVSMGIILTMLLTFLISFVAPMQSFAEAKAPASSSAGDDIGGVDVTVDSNGKLVISGNNNFVNGGTASAWGDLFKKYRTFIVGISGIGAISMIAFFIVQFMKLGASSGNPQARSQALAGVLWTGLAAAGLGAVTIVVGFFYNSIR